MVPGRRNSDPGVAVVRGPFSIILDKSNPFAEKVLSLNRMASGSNDNRKGGGDIVSRSFKMMLCTRLGRNGDPGDTLSATMMGGGMKLAMLFSFEIT
jgi:hypothetical protein